MPIQVDPPRKLKDGAVAALAVLVLIGVVIATNWRALILLLVVLAAGAGWWLAQ